MILGTKVFLKIYYIASTSEYITLNSTVSVKKNNPLPSEGLCDSLQDLKLGSTVPTGFEFSVFFLVTYALS